tara:strand:+ start:2466 stop:2870 length:405 start_codon:yes stop_codon:yes gene_type:complete
MKPTLSKIAGKLNGNIKWYLVGSANLSLRGAEVDVRDLDILTDEAGAQKFREIFQSEFRHIDGLKQSQIYEIYTFLVEVFSANQLNVTPNIMEIGGQKIPLMPLKELKVLYEKKGTSNRQKDIEELQESIRSIR